MCIKPHVVNKPRNLSSKVENDFMVSRIWKIVVLRDIIHNNAMMISAAGLF